MSKFFVGQRVRMARPKNPCNLGVTGTILGIGHWGVGDRIPNGFFAATQMDVYVAWDSPVTVFSMSGQFALRKACANSDRLEPIIDQKHEACEEDFKRDLDRLLERQGVSA